MNDDAAVKNALDVLEAQERELSDSLIDLETRLARVRAARASLMALITDEPTEFEGKLADAIRTVLKAKSASYAPMAIRDKVMELGYMFNEGSNQMAAVHGVLKRLWEAGEVQTKEIQEAPGVTRYFWHTFESHLAHGRNTTNHRKSERSPKTQKSGVARVIADSQARREKLLGKTGDDE